MSEQSRHTDWLSLIERSGSFLNVPVLEKVYPQGLEALNTHVYRRIRIGWEEWREAVDEQDPDLKELHEAWIKLVLSEVLEFDDSVLTVVDKGTFDKYVLRNNENSEIFYPSFLVTADNNIPFLLIKSVEPDQQLDSSRAIGGRTSTHVESMIALCRLSGVSFGVITNGEQWVLVWAPKDGPASYGVWHARIWVQERITFRAFQSLLSIRKWYGPSKESLDAMLRESLEHNEELTNTLGEQVRQAVEVLIQSLDKADLDRNRELLKGVSPKDLYEAGLTVMMRLVFILSAEERDLLLLGSAIYDQFYAVSSLRNQLAEESERNGAEILENRHDAWSRLLAVFRAIYGGINHDNLRLPALGGSLFNPDRFPFLEGRVTGKSWADSEAFIPLPINNRTVLLLLNALQVLDHKGGALLLSYKGLDVEQIGHVYEGLLEYTVERIPEITLGLKGSGRSKNPNISLKKLEEASRQNKIRDLLRADTLRSESAIRNDIENEIDEVRLSKLGHVCGGDLRLTERLKPFANLLREDAWGDLLLYKANSFAVTLGADRRETGTHYTPRSLTENVVKTTLEPLVYVGPAEGWQEEEWKLKSSSALLELTICDPAMGSGAFLVQVCRYLSDKVVESWALETRQGLNISADGKVVKKGIEKELLPESLNERQLIARRLVAERCLYGVDINPLAVELAKLSIWLVTVAKDRPFGFLDHNLRAGDSLLGVHKLWQLTNFTLVSERSVSIPLFASDIESAVKEVVTLRKKLRQTSIRDIRDVEYMETLDREARKKIENIQHVADAIIGEALAAGEDSIGLQKTLDNLSARIKSYLNGDSEQDYEVVGESRKLLALDLPEGEFPRKPFHWALEFPEVFESGGFHGIIGNPPYLGAPKISGTMGKHYRGFLVAFIANGRKGLADFSAYFLLRLSALLSTKSSCGLVVTSGIAEGDTRTVGLQHLLDEGYTIYSANNRAPWPGKANVTYSSVWICPYKWNGISRLNGVRVVGITSQLTEKESFTGQPFALSANKSKSFNGVKVYGKGFVISPEESQRLIYKNEKNRQVIFPYMTTEDLNSHPTQEASAFAIRFFDWPLNKESAESDYVGPVATDFPDCLEIIEDRVKPERTRLNNKGQFVIRKPMPQLWWIYGEKRPGLYSAIAKLDHVLAVGASATKYVSFVILQKEMVFSHSLTIIADDSFEAFAILNSSYHEVWARQYGSYNLQLLRYTASDIFETFPFPLPTRRLNELGQEFNKMRSELMIKLGDGITGIYNRFHSPTNDHKDIGGLRALQIEIDKEVGGAYGWSSVQLEHGFHETGQGVRFTFSDRIRREVLQRLLKLNHERHERELKEGSNKKVRSKKVPTVIVDQGQHRMFE
jgi:hypothetical protein